MDPATIPSLVVSRTEPGAAIPAELMTTELRFLFAIALMVGVLVVTNVLFPPTVPESPTGPVADTAAEPASVTQSPTSPSGTEPEVEPPFPAGSLPFRHR